MIGKVFVKRAVKTLRVSTQGRNDEKYVVGPVCFLTSNSVAIIASSWESMLLQCGGCGEGRCGERKCVGHGGGAWWL